jgi:hypothetical protein
MGMEMSLPRRQAATVAAVALSLAALAAGAGDARAGTYHVYGCRTPSGQPAPADGWSGSVAPGGAFDQYARNTCAEGGALVAALGDQTVHGANIDQATWRFVAPAGLSLIGATLWRAGDTAGGGTPTATYAFDLAGPTESLYFDPCGATLGCASQGTSSQPLSEQNRVVVPQANLGSRLYASATCSGFAGAECAAGSGDPTGYAAAVNLYASDITLEQNAVPTVSGVGGELASAATLRGTDDLTFTASDPGSGVYEAVVTVDGQVVQAELLNENGGRCRSAGTAPDGRPAFLYVQPCLASLSADVALDTTKLSDGAHHLVVSVLDAAGNSAPVLDREVTVSNPVALCGAGSAAGASSQATLVAAWRGTRRGRLTSAFGRAQTIVGQLTSAAGAPLSGATIDVVATPAYRGAAAQAASVQSGPGGRFSVRVAGGVSSRTLCLSYRPPGGVPVTRSLVLNVRAGISLSVSPRTSSAGHEIFFRGRLLGGPIPPAGKQLVLEARSPRGPWLQFRLVRSGRHGRFTASYRFRFPGPATYQFRAVSEPESDYPFAAGASDVVAVRER